MAFPEFAPKQFTSVRDPTLVARVAAGCAMVTFRMVVHPFRSVTVHIHVPAARPVALAPFCIGVVFHE